MKTKKVISLILSVCIVISCFAGMQINSYAYGVAFNSGTYTVDKSVSSTVAVSGLWVTDGWGISGYGCKCNGVSGTQTATASSGNTFALEFTFDISSWDVGSYQAEGYLSLYNPSNALLNGTTRGYTTIEVTCGHNGAKTGSQTCTTSETCSVCGAVTAAALGHNYVSTVISPTCTSGGYTQHVCSRCSDSYTDKQTGALGHSWDSGVITTQPTCQATGVKTYTCTRCSTTRTEEIAKVDHNIVTLPAVSATCTQTGLTEGSQCSYCGTVFVAQTVTAALGHSWDEGVETKPATPTETGIMTYTCTRGCGATRTEDIPVLTGLLLAIYNAEQIIAEYENGDSLFTSNEGFESDWATFQQAYNNAIANKESSQEEQEAASL